MKKEKEIDLAKNLIKGTSERIEDIREEVRKMDEFLSGIQVELEKFSQENDSVIIDKMRKSVRIYYLLLTKISNLAEGLKIEMCWHNSLLGELLGEAMKRGIGIWINF